MEKHVQKLWDEALSGKVKQHEKIFPNQYFNNFLWERSKDETYESYLYGLLEDISHLPLKKEEFFADEERTIDELASSSVVLNFLCMILKLTTPRVVFEIGSFVGFSTCNLAATMQPQSKLVTIEKFERFANTTIRNVSKFGLESKVKVICGDAKTILKTYDFGDEPIDFAFIDGDKQDYPFYVEWFVNRLSSNGFLVVDDILFHGDTLNENCKTEKGMGVKSVLNFLRSREDLSVSLLPIANGLLFIKPKNS